MSKIRDTDYLTISARVHAMENRMLTRERMDRMIDARDEGEALKVLSECGYGGTDGVSGQSLEGLLAQARAETFREIRGAIPNPRVADLFQMKYDYHNAKALVKGAAVGADADRLLMEGGRWSAAQVKEAFQRDSLREFTGPFRRAVVQARETLNGGNDPQLADFVLDRAYFAEMAETARAVGSPFLEGYVRLLIDATNLRSAVRAALSALAFARASFPEAPAAASSSLAFWRAAFLISSASASAPRILEITSFTILTPIPLPQGKAFYQQIPFPTVLLSCHSPLFL